MNLSKQIAYRVALATGFLREAEQDFTLERWRSCVDNAQLTVENVGKAVLALFGIVPKTHDPARQIAAILRGQELPENISELLRAMLPDLLVLGTESHFLTDYGDEANFILPWDLFTQRTAEDALQSAKKLVEMIQTLPDLMNSWREDE